MLEETSTLVIRDPRVSEEDNNIFLDTLEKYFEQKLEDKMNDVYPDLHYQIGATPEGVEHPKCLVDETCHETIKEVCFLFRFLRTVIVTFCSYSLTRIQKILPSYQLDLILNGDSSTELAPDLRLPSSKN